MKIKDRSTVTRNYQFKSEKKSSLTGGVGAANKVCKRVLVINVKSETFYIAG